MKFTMKDGKTVILVMVAIFLMGLVFYFGEDIPGIEQAREGFTD